MTAERLKEYAAKGADALDGLHPGWAEKIVLTEFDMNSPCGCVLGQLYGDYYAGVRALERNGVLMLPDVTTFGFLLPYDLVGHRWWDVLELHWVDEIRRRLT